MVDDDTIMHMQPAACGPSNAEIDDAKRWTHDAVIALAGSRRRSGVRWRILHGRREAVTWLEEYMTAGDDDFAGLPEIRAGLEQLKAFFDENPLRGRLVVAFCESVR